MIDEVARVRWVDHAESITESQRCCVLAQGRAQRSGNVPPITEFCGGSVVNSRDQCAGSPDHLASRASREGEQQDPLGRNLRRR